MGIGLALQWKYSSYGILQEKQKSTIHNALSKQKIIS